KNFWTISTSQLHCLCQAQRWHTRSFRWRSHRSTTGQSPISSLNLHCSIALKSVVPIPHSLELFFVPFLPVPLIALYPDNLLLDPTLLFVADYESFESFDYPLINKLLHLT
ncbi:MAG: hypothetical protein ACYT04_33095, partial [Nostoc sp.]